MTYPGVAPSGYIFHSTNDQNLHAFDILGGDVSGILGSVSVQKIQGVLIDSAAPASGDLFQFDGTQWIHSPGSSVSHDLLSSTHSDVTPGVVTRGDIVFGSGASPTWARLPLGPAEFVMYSDGTDVLYTRLGPNTPFELGSAGAPSHTFTGDEDTGLSAASANVMVASASGVAVMTIESADGGEIVTIDGGQVLRTRVVAGGAQAMLNDDYILLVTAGGGTVSLPGGPRSGQKVIVKDRDGNATPGGGNRITIDGNGNNIDGNTLIRITNAYGAFTLLYNGTEWNVI